MDQFVSHSSCTCPEFCERCSVRYVLQKKCPPDLDQCEVTSNDIKLEPGQSDAH